MNRLSASSQIFRDVNTNSDEEGWQILFYYSLYRLGLTALLIALASPVIGKLTVAQATTSFILPVAGIAAISLITLVNIQRRKPALYLQAHFLFVMDILFITILTFSRYLLDSSTIILYVTTAAATAVLFHLRVSITYTIVCAILILYKDYLEFVAGSKVLDTYYLTPLLLTGLFSIVVIVGMIANQSRNVKTVVQKQERELADLDQVNQYILEHLEIGVLLLDDKLNIQLINDTAKGLVQHFIGSTYQIKGELGDRIKPAMQSPGNREFNFRINNRELAFTTLPLATGYLIQIEDLSRVQRQIQQSKLASIGRMASAISHEIRNPLSAINHAAQLLAPPPGAKGEQAELIQIIRTHSKRIDEIIESVLQRSRPSKVQRIAIELQSQLAIFTETFQHTVGENVLELSVKGDNPVVMFDQTQLEQIVTNLCQNSIKYAKPDSGRLVVRFFAGLDRRNRPYLDITDNGQGVKKEDIDQLFEPFYTSDSKSTGLGLFLVRELCDFNGARIEYQRVEHKRGHFRHGFRIIFEAAPRSEEDTAHNTAEQAESDPGEAAVDQFGASPQISQG